MHDHKECEHEFKYCSKYDVVYCVKCNKEWVQRPLYKITYGQPYTYSDGTIIQPDNIITYEVHNCFDYVPHS